MLRLTPQAGREGEIVLVIDGWMTGANADLVEREVLRLSQSQTVSEVDLQGVRSIDRRGIAVLGRLISNGLEIRGGSSYVDLLLEGSWASRCPWL